MLTMKFQNVNIAKVLLFSSYFGGYCMSYEKVKKASNKIIGTKQTVKALKSGEVIEVFIALDVDSKIKNRVIETAREMNVPITTVDSMQKLGKACGIDVGAATVAITR